MKLRKLLRRMTAALVAGAMALSLCAPALAADPGEAADDGPRLTFNGVKLEIKGSLNTYDPDTNTFTLTDLPNVNEDFHLDVIAGADGKPVNLELNMDLSQRIYFGGAINRLVYNGIAEKDLQSDRQSSIGSVEIKGTVKGLVQMQAKGDITIHGAVNCASSYSDWQFILDSSEGNVTIENPDGVPFRADQTTYLTARNGKVSITGSVSGVMLSDALHVRSLSMDVTNNAAGGSVGILHFTPTESGTYKINGNPVELIADVDEVRDIRQSSLTVTPTDGDPLPTLEISRPAGSTSKLVTYVTPTTLDDANKALAPSTIRYNSATHTYTLDINENFSEGMYIYATSSKGIVPSLTVNVNSEVGDLYFANEIDALTVNGSVAGSLETNWSTRYDAVVGNFTLNGNVSGLLDVTCRGDARVKGTLSEVDSDQGPYRNQLVSLSGNVVVTSPEALPQMSLIAPEGGVWVTGSSSGPLMATIPYVYAQKLVMYNNGGGGFPPVNFLPTLSGDYYINNKDELQLPDDAPLPTPGGSYTVPETSGTLLTVALKDADIELPADTDISDIGTAPAGDVGGALAAVAIGGAAVWGGYEIATRVILHHLLPEGAAIPKTQAELALLLWNTAGSPEPASTPAFADLDDTTAKAAQWCAEQGYLTGTFKPEKHVAKYNVIRAWAKAFPKAG